MVIDMSNYAIVENDVVINVVVWDGTNDWTPPAGSQAIEVTSSMGTPWIGLGYANGAFAQPNTSS